MARASNDRFVVRVWAATLLLLAGASGDNPWTSSDHRPAAEVTFVLVGATGNLAQKYLWQGLYDLYAANGSEGGSLRLSVYGAARAEASAGAAALKRILEEKVRYDSDDHREAFGGGVRFVQLKTCGDYEAFCAGVLNRNGDAGHCSREEEAPSSCGTPEAGRVFYLAVPPYSYGDVAECVHRVCRPPSNPASSSAPWLRVVLEKPYGSDLDGVTALTTSLLRSYAEDEIYLIDHYLGKAALKQILPFRSDNREWLEPLLSNDFVDRVEVVIKEQEDAEGRLNYYDSYGVFLDILQNHAMEMLTLVAMDLPPALNDSLAIRERKVDFLKSVAPVHPRHLLAGQYEGYVQHGKVELKNEAFDSRTATFGAVLLRVPTPRWSGVPFFLTSGKALDAKESYVRVAFKDSAFGPGGSDPASPPPPQPLELLVTVGARHGDVDGPSVAVSAGLLAGLPSVIVRSEWPEEASASGGHSVFRRRGEDRAYSAVLSDVVFARRESFVGLGQLAASWNMWSLAVDHLKSPGFRPKPYGKGDVDGLRIRWTPEGLVFADGSGGGGVEEEEEEKSSAEDRLLAGGAAVLVMPTGPLIDRMARDLLESALESVRERGVFHVAFPGGRSPRPLFHALAAERRFPWRRTHVWFSDERCVAFGDRERSNFWNAEEELLRHVWVSRAQVHPMPVALARGLCHPEDLGAELYAQRIALAGTLDAVVLGVGADGHVASLFPHAVEGDLAEERWVALTRAPPGAPVEGRMSLTFRAIGQAREVFVVVTGKDKHGVAERLLREGDAASGEPFPVGRIANREGVRLYVDELAYRGQ